ncbi:hypothetical protein NF27_CT00010 [Candidatus Jidaibacter acanthamoeba]|uniref:Uncharacterized protein n=1 Tax=Candidatus Jidaibacter acanthamoebae TaxID=86105 RepID=A0A0C1R0E7_9RICK|nr:hypothetical protein NF27_CT00010 [Candidatus Jidaibacter acanthamoeba]
MKKRSKSKVKYKINNWKEYNQFLKNRGPLTVWIGGRYRAVMVCCK